MLNKTVSYPCFVLPIKSCRNIIVFCKIYNLPLIIESTSAQLIKWEDIQIHQKFKELILKFAKKNLKSLILSLAVTKKAIKNSKILINHKLDIRKFTLIHHTF